MGEDLLDEGDAFAGGVELLAVADDVGEVEEALDDGGAGGFRAEAAAFHGFAEFVFFNLAAGGFHGGEEGGIGVAGRGLALLGDEFGVLDGEDLADFDRGEGLAVFGVGGSGVEVLIAVQGGPAGGEETGASGSEGVGFPAMFSDQVDAGFFGFFVGEEDGEEAFGDEGVDLAFFWLERLAGAGLAVGMMAWWSESLEESTKRFESGGPCSARWRACCMWGFLIFAESAGLGGLPGRVAVMSSERWREELRG